MLRDPPFGRHGVHPPLVGEPAEHEVQPLGVTVPRGQGVGLHVSAICFGPIRDIQ
jgi:hypothetical protein